MTRPAWRALEGPIATHAGAIVVAVLVVCGFALGSSYVRATRAAGAQDLPGFNQRVFGAALMSACGHGLTTPVVSQRPDATTPGAERPLADFLSLKRETLSCAEVPAGVAIDGLDSMQRDSWYLQLLPAAVWKLTGPSWQSIDRLLGAMYGLTSALAYLVCRVAMVRPVAAGIAVALLASPMHLANLPDLRDYAKAPFFLATLLMVGWVVTARRNPVRLVAASAAAGLVLGVGLGIRTDIAVNVVLVLAAVAGFAPGRLQDTWRARVLAAVLCVSGFAITATPVLRSQESGSNLWHWALLGYAGEWDHALEIRPGPYETGHFYSDSHVATVVDAYWGRVTPGAGKVSVGIPEYAKASRGYYSQLVTTFPADVLVRCWASMIQVLNLPYAGSGAMPSGRVPDGLRRVIGVANRFRAQLAGAGVWLFILMILALSAHSTRLALAVFALVIFLSGYPAIQFQVRHVFQLELLSLWILGFLVSSAYARITHRADATASGAHFGRPAVFAAVMVAVVIVPLRVTRAYQAGTAATLLGDYDVARIETVTVTPEPVGGGVVRLAAADRALSRSRPPRSMSSDMLVAEIGAGGCAADRVAVTFRYAAKDPSIDFTQTLDIKVPPAGGRTKVFFPVYESRLGAADGDRLAFDGVEVAESEAPCVLQLGRFAEPDRYPLLLATVLAPDWRVGPLHQTLASWESSAAARDDGTRIYAAPLGLRGLRIDSGARRDLLRDTGETIDFQARIGRLDREAGLTVNGVSDAPHAYLLAWKPQAFGVTDTVVAEGRVDRGGLTVGIVEGSRWIAKVDIDRTGGFRALVRAPSPGHYQVVVANHLSNTSLRNRFTISRMAVADAGHE